MWIYIQKQPMLGMYDVLELNIEVLRTFKHKEIFM
jgi:hypothetical protein